MKEVCPSFYPSDGILRIQHPRHKPYHISERHPYHQRNRPACAVGQVARRLDRNRRTAREREREWNLPFHRAHGVQGHHNRSAEHIAREVDSIGGDLDAFTAKELVSYNIKVLDEHVPIAFDVLADLVLDPRFDEADIEKEKGVILEELKMEVDNPEYLVHEIFFSQFWKNHPLGRSILGTKATIGSFNQEHNPTTITTTSIRPRTS